MKNETPIGLNFHSEPPSPSNDYPEYAEHCEAVIKVQPFVTEPQHQNELEDSDVEQMVKINLHTGPDLKITS